MPSSTSLPSQACQMRRWAEKLGLSLALNLHSAEHTFVAVHQLTSPISAGGPHSCDRQARAACVALPPISG